MHSNFNMFNFHLQLLIYSCPITPTNFLDQVLKQLHKELEFTDFANILRVKLVKVLVVYYSE